MSVSVRRMSRNRGFARAVNEGCRVSQGEWLLLLNPDMSVQPGFLDEVDRVARHLAAEDPRAGIIGFRLTHSDGTPQASSGPWPTFTRTLAGLCLPRAIRKCRVLNVESRVRVPWVTGCCLLIHRDCLNDLGGLDERFFLYYEDVDLCLRATERAWNVYFEPTLEVTHHSPLHTRHVPPPLRLMIRHALLTYGAKHWMRWQTWLMGGMIWTEACFRQFKSWWRGDKLSARFHSELRQLVREVLSHNDGAIRQRIRKVAIYLQESAAAQDRKTEFE
jgi:GT2 family glycosyltransferase